MIEAQKCVLGVEIQDFGLWNPKLLNMRDPQLSTSKQDTSKQLHTHWYPHDDFALHSLFGPMFVIEFAPILPQTLPKPHRCSVDLCPMRCAASGRGPKALDPVVSVASHVVRTLLRSTDWLGW